jgi:hypothetical protein
MIAAKGHKKRIETNSLRYLRAFAAKILHPMRDFHQLQKLFLPQINAD